MIPWKTASDSMNSCVQVARGDVVWARCAGGDCLEAVRTTGDHSRVLVRDSKEAPDYHVQQWTPREWAELLRALRIDAEHPAVEKLDNGLILLGSGPDQPVHRYTQVEWDAFTRGALKGMFEYESLPDVGEWIEPSSCKCSKLSGPAEASPGGGPAAGREGLDTGQTSSTRAEARHGHDPTSNPVSRVLPVVQAEKAATGAEVTVPDIAPVAAEPLRCVSRKFIPAGVHVSPMHLASNENEHICYLYCRIDGTRVVQHAGVHRCRCGVSFEAADDMPVAADRPPAETTPGKRESPEGVLTAIGPEWRPDPATGAGEVGATSSQPAPVAAPLTVNKMSYAVPVARGECERCGTPVAYNLAAGLVDHTTETACEAPTIGGYTPMAEKTLNELLALTAPVAAESLISPAGRHPHAESHREVAASTGSGEVVRLSVPGRPGSLVAALNLLYSPAGRLDEDPAPPLGPSLATAPAVGQPGPSSSVPNQEDPPLTWHAGRAWSGHEIEDACPCPQEPCGLVSKPDPECVQHSRTKTIRQSHRADQCPALGAGIKWTEDSSLGEPQGPSKGAARRAGQGPGFADRSGVEAAGTGVLPPALVPVAEPRVWSLAVEPSERVTHVRDFYGDVWEHRVSKIDARDWCCDGMALSWSQLLVEYGPLTDATRAVAPLVPTDGAS